MIRTICFHKMVVVFGVLTISLILSTCRSITTTANDGLPAKCTRNCVSSSKKVCGNDGKTYQSECHLKKRACVAKDLVKECNGPCKKVRGHTCCNIKKKCPKKFRISGPVCGTNGVTYPNLCLLAIAICKENGLKIRGDRKCSELVSTTQFPTTLGEGDFCIDEKLGKKCSGECKTVNGVHCCDIRIRCPQVFKDSGHVCGTDGVSYVNQCILAKKTCRTSGLNLEKDYDGKCRENEVTTLSPILMTTDLKKIEKSVTDSQNCSDAELGKKCNGECKFVHGVDCCIILQACPIPFNESGPVCGNDNITYSNLCTLSRKACKIFDSQLRHSYMGVCKIRGNETIKQETNLQTYPTTIVMATSTKTHEQNLTLGAHSIMESGENLLPTMNSFVQYTRKTLTDSNEYITEVITTPASTDYLTKDEFSTSPSVSVTKSPDDDVYCNDTESGKNCRGECKSVNGVHCCDIRKQCPEDFKRNGPICGTDLITYRNLCELAKKACRTAGSTLQKLGYGVCEELSFNVTESLIQNIAQPTQEIEVTESIEKSTSETISATVTETFIPSTPTYNQMKTPTTSTQNYVTEIIYNVTTFGVTFNNNIDNASHCEDKVLGKKCMADCKFVSGVHCCDIIDTGCPKSFTLSGHVCGSDGSSYSNLCVLARRSCQMIGSSLAKVRYGRCDETSTVITDEDANANVKIVCVDKKRGKSCNGECKVVNGQHCCDIRNRCPNKLKKTGSVCGNDGRTYGNQCALARKSCREHGSALVMSYKGPCKKATDPKPTRKTVSIFEDRLSNKLPGDGDMTMPPFLITDLLIQRDRIKEDPCQVDCPSWDSPVCGSNMVTYRNACELKKVQCKRPSIRQFCEARCRMDDGRNCCMMMKKCHKSLRNTGTVCGSDGKSYNNECDLFREACRSVDYNLQKLHDGPCPPDQPKATKMKFSMIECLSTFHCPIEFAMAGEVCSDIGTTYQDECALRFDSCWGDNRNIGLDYVGRCKP